MKIQVASGYWSQNIGNAFFQLGSRAFLEQAAEPDDRVSTLPDHPANWTLVSKAKGGPANALDSLEVWDPDVLVISGPSLRRGFEKMWVDTLQRHKSRGGRVLLMGIGLFHFDDEERELVRRVADLDLIDFASARDSRTYEVLSNAGIPSYNGLDSAMYLPWAYEPNVLSNAGNFAVLNFDRLVEPKIELRESGTYSTTLGNLGIEGQNLDDKIAKLGHSMSYAIQHARKGHVNESIGDLEVISTSNRTNPPLHYINYRRKNSFVSDEPFSYLDLLGNARLTVSDRVHSVVATLVYGGEALFYNETPRASLLDQVGLNFEKGACFLDQELVEKKRLEQLSAVRGFLDSVRTGSASRTLDLDANTTVLDSVRTG